MQNTVEPIQAAWSPSYMCLILGIGPYREVGFLFGWSQRQVPLLGIVFFIIFYKSIQQACEHTIILGGHSCYISIRERDQFQEYNHTVSLLIYPLPH